jgi:uncharacterized damage-inducible protein DinB
MHPNPYGNYIEGRDVLASMEDTPRRIASLVRGWPRDRDQRSHAPGKWTARQVLAHLVHVELIFATRLRFALADAGCRIQTFEQDDWMREETPPAALVSLDAYLALRAMNVALLRSLSREQRARTAIHPEWDAVDVDWLAAWCAGHELNHLPQFEAVANARTSP